MKKEAMSAVTTEAMTKIAEGIFTWDSEERRSNRYGSFAVADETYEGHEKAVPKVDRDALRYFLGERVRLVVKVTVSRKSGHLGDLILGIAPSRTAVGQCIDLGVGRLWSKEGWNGYPLIGMRPDDGRSELWIDPRLLYQLHDHTVEVFVAMTTDPCSPAPDIKSIPSEPMAVSAGDGAVQVKHVRDDEMMRFPPKITKVGRGCFVVTPSGAEARGEPVAIEVVDRKHRKS